jgi:hypothetical protein
MSMSASLAPLLARPADPDRPALLLPLALGLLLSLSSHAAADTLVFTTDFESGLPGEIDAPGAAIQGVQDWAGLGDGERVFAGGFLRHSAPAYREIALTLTDLPAHGALSIEVLVALIDSWDSEHFQVLVDGEVVFDEWFDLAVSHASSYSPPAGALLSAGSDLGYTAGGYYSDDRAYDLSVDDRLTDIPHTNDTATIVWRVDDEASGGWQGGGDESWAIERVTVTVGEGTSAVETESWGRTKARYRE